MTPGAGSGGTVGILVEGAGGGGAGVGIFWGDMMGTSGYMESQSSKSLWS